MPDSNNRLVSIRRPIANADIDDTVDLNAVELDEDGGFTIAETVTSDAVSESRRKSLRKRLGAHTPAEHAIHGALSAALEMYPDALDQRLDGRNPFILVAVRLPSYGWWQEAKEAFEAYLLAQGRTRPDISLSLKSFQPETVRWRGDDPVIEAAAVLSALRTSHVIITYDPSFILSPTLEQLADARIDLSDFGKRFLASALDRAFGCNDSTWPLVLTPDSFEARLFDAACSRAADGAGVIALVADLAVADALEKEANRKAEAKASLPSARKTTAIEILRPTSPKLVDLHGYGAAAAWGEQLAVDIADYRTGVIGWADVDAGCLLYGPPGTGKTMFASALSATCGVNFIATSFAAWQGSKGGYLGDVVQAMRAVFAAASEAAPCILFIDEIDGLPARGASRDHDTYWRPLVNALLECLDGTSRRDGLVVIAACNDPSGIDGAVTRSGRLDRRFEISLPDEESLSKIFWHHLPDLDPEVLAPVATALAGSTSGADVARIAREARRSARRARRSLVADDLLGIALPPDTRPDGLRRLIAIHEAGHAVISMISGETPRYLSVVLDTATGAGGGIGVSSGLGESRIGDIRRHVMTLLAGRAAEEVILGQASAGASRDLEWSTSMLARTVGEFGLGGMLTHGGQIDAGGIEGSLRRLYAETVLLVVQHRREIVALADLALERRVLSSSALAAFAAEHRLGGC